MLEEFKFSHRLMGSIFEFIIVCESENKAEAFLNLALDEIMRLESLLSEFKSDSIVSKINDNAGRCPVQVPNEVFQLIKRSIAISNLTQGAFDITVSPLKKLYNFKNENFQFPTETDLKSALNLVDYSKLELLDGQSVFLKKEGMKLSLSAIGKGYAADMVKKIWMENGLESGVISASGDLCSIGSRIDGTDWKIGIADPNDRQKSLLYLPLNNGAIATSGDYEQFFIYKGKKYGHNINPKSGLPVSGIKSVSVASRSAELSDALATAVYIMGVEAGTYLIDQLPDIHCLIIDDKNILHFSKNIIFEHAK